MLEYNLYDNFNPNIMERDKEANPDTGNLYPKGIPAPRGRGVLLDYEVFQTGYEFTSSATMTIPCYVGDVVEVLTTEDNSLAITEGRVISQRLSMWFVITDVDEDNRVVMQNYFWYMIEGSSYPTAQIYGWASTGWNIVTTLSNHQVMYWGSMANWDETNMEIKYNMKADTVEMKDLAKATFAKIELQPITFAYNMTGVSSPQLQVGLLTDEWTRHRKELRIDEVQNPTIEKVVVTERSNYNFVKTFVKDAGNDKYPIGGETYTINTSGNLVKMSTYTGDGRDLPELRITKTMFYDEQPTDAQIKSEVTGDSTISKIYFNQNKLYPLQVNDRVRIWYDGTMYDGHIADRSLTPDSQRLTFIEGTSL